VWQTPHAWITTTASPGPGIGDDDGLHRDGFALGAGDDASNFLTHVCERSALVLVVFDTTASGHGGSEWNLGCAGNVEPT
jgi:hypothetical protein